MAASSKKAPESLATGRAPRANAGNRMSKLLAEETEDDFYKTAFGGFEEESGDEEYDTDDEGDDVVDSDFDADESDGEENAAAAGSDSDEPKRKRSRHAYKDPKAKKPEAGRTRSRTASLRQSKETKESKETKPAATGSAASAASAHTSTPALKNEALGARRKSYRLATVEQRREHERRQEESRNKPKKVVKQTQHRRLTQEEILAESEITERENLASLDAYRRLEEEKKKAKAPKPKIIGPVIRFHSITAPMVNANASTPVEVLAEPMEVGGSSHPEGSKGNAEQCRPQCCRNFVTFTDVGSFPHAYFPARKHKHPQRPACCVTGLPAKYRDPLTKMPYATAEAFRIIRAHYARKQHQHA